MSLQRLLNAWEGRDAGWDSSPALYELLGSRILAAGEPLLAHDVLREGLRVRPRDVRLRQLEGLALARSGAAESARELFSGLRAEGHRDEETLGMLARTYKDLSSMAEGARESREMMRMAHRTYAEAFRLHRGYYAGINAAATALLLGKKRTARSIAGKVGAICRRRFAGPAGRGGEAYWLTATLGEAALIMGDWDAAEEWYSRAARLAKGKFADLGTTRRQARLLMESIGHPNADRIEACFRVPKVVVFTGHMIDRPGRRRPRFPAALEPRVAAEIRERVKKLDAGFAFASAACGSDILFAEAMLDRGAEVQIVLPVPAAEMHQTSVDFAGGKWAKRFERVLKRASRVHVAAEQGSAGGEAVFEYANLLLDGLAMLKAGMLDTELSALCVWDKRAGLPGGTGSFVGHWRRRRQKVDIIDLEGLRSGRPKQGRGLTRAKKARAPKGGFPQKIMSLLFADAVGYSKLREQQIPRFSTRFLGEVSRLIGGSWCAPVTRNVWGDAVYFAFTTPEKAGHFALDMSGRIGRVDWAERGLPKELDFRVALHAGPVYAYTNPITRQFDYTGAHVSRAARIEPITPPGQVYASQAFAALAAALGAKGFACDYVGQVPLAKGYGTFPLYHVRHVKTSRRGR